MGYGYGYKYGYSEGETPTGFRITQVKQTQAGSCDLVVADPCTATSIHQVFTADAVGAVTYTWTAPAGTTITAGQGTDTVTVESTGDVNQLFILQCECFDTVDTVNRDTAVFHDRDSEAQIIDDPGFNGGGSWSGNPAWSIATSELIGTNVSNVGYWNGNAVVEIGEKYECVVRITEWTAGELRFYLKGIFHTLPNSVGTYRFDMTAGAGSTNLQFLGINTYNGKIAFVSVKKAVANFGANLVSNGDFSNGAVDWTDMTVNSGVATTVGSNGYQIITTVIGKQYRYRFDCDRKGVTPALFVRENDLLGAIVSEVDVLTNGFNTSTSTFTATTTSTCINFSNGSDTALWDNVSVQAIL